jgi:hypothetical protein
MLRDACGRGDQMVDVCLLMLMSKVPDSMTSEPWSRGGARDGVCGGRRMHPHDTGDHEEHHCAEHVTGP